LVKLDHSRFGMNFVFGKQSASDPRRNEVVRPPAAGLMRARLSSRPLARTALLMILGAGSWFCACAQQAGSPGSLSGSLTDLHSAPLAKVTLTLRNRATGAEQHLITSRTGRYRFGGLPAGAYSLIAAGPLGTGRVDDIAIASGHESQVRIALELKPAPAEIASRPTIGVAVSGRTLEPLSPEDVLETAGAPVLRISPPPQPEIQIAAEDLLSVPIPSASGKRGPPAGSNPAPLQPAPPPGGNGVAQGPPPVAVRVPAEQIESASTAPESLDASQLQALPLAGRNWQNFVLGGAAPNRDPDDEERTRASVGLEPQITADGARIQLAFGGTGNKLSRNAASSLISPVTGDASIREVQMIDVGAGSSINIEPQRGTGQLHGQAFLFDRQNMLGAQNPFTQWVQQTSPATGSSVPVFTPLAYSPGDREATWGAGLGGVLHRRRLLWFAALDGYQRNDPAVSTVKHPDDFFAQPTNDQMQLLGAQLGISTADPVSAGLGPYSKLLESLAGLLGPAPRSTSQWTGFGRLDWKAGERHRFAVESSGASLNSL